VVERTAAISAPRPNPERPVECLAPLAVELDVAATVAGVDATDDRARVAVRLELPDQTVQLVWPTPQQWTPADGRWALALPVYIVQPQWTDAAPVRIEIVYQPAEADAVGMPRVVPLSAPVLYHIHPKPAPL